MEDTTARYGREIINKIDIMMITLPVIINNGRVDVTKMKRRTKGLLERKKTEERTKVVTTWRLGGG